ncbi:MAG: DNA gyrase inhibitor YacG [Geminicoccaceae bacterium]
MADEGTAKDEAPPPPARRCPLCGKPAEQHYRPFCSARCRDQDLLNWLGGRYAIPAQESEAEVEEEER